jgi:hypothetical protein
MVRLLSKDGGRFPFTACETQCKVNTTILKGSPVFVNEFRKVMARAEWGRHAALLAMPAQWV